MIMWRQFRQMTAFGIKPVSRPKNVILNIAKWARLIR